MHDRWKSRFVGGGMTCMALLGVRWVWQDAHVNGSFSGKLAFICPVLVAVGLWTVIEGPELPAHRMSPLGWVFTGLGCVAGLILHHYLSTGQVPLLG